MSKEELRRVEVLARVKSQELKLRDAAELMGVSYRQAKRLWKRYRRRGAGGVRHGSAGRLSNRAKPKALRRKVLRLIRQKYSGELEERFGPTLAAEHLRSEDGLEVDAETLRRWMLAEGLWTRVRKSRGHRERRVRKEHFGELVQMDGSFHEWLEGRGAGGCLMNMVDDATGKTLGRLGEQETIWAAANVLRRWIEKYGVPLALYTDWNNVYLREPTAKEEMRGEVPVTQFGRMCQKLNIRIIGANSAQAKGRVERNHGTHQDRLVKKMRRKNIGTHEQANEYLEREYLLEHNQRFARQPAQAEDYHRAAPAKRELDEIFRLETTRTISNDWVVRHHNRYFQLKRRGRHYAPAQGKVLVCEWKDGRMEIEYRGQKLEWEGIAELPTRPASPTAKPMVKPSSRRQPSADHPWRQGYDGMRARGAGRSESPTLPRLAASAP